MFVCFYLTVILVRRKIFPKNGKRMKMVQNFGNLVVQELPYHLKYRSFGLLMPSHDIQQSETQLSDIQKSSIKGAILQKKLC